MELTERVKAWAERGESEDFRGHSIHVTLSEGEGPLLVYLHGFPSSSYDWRHLLDLDPGQASLAFDFLGFGLSDKPRDHTYGLAWQADLTEELFARHGGGRPAFICAHDMGTSVATELFARDIAGELGFSIAGALLFNGSMILELASPTFAQKMLRSRLGPVAARFSSERFFRAQFSSIFSEGHPLTDDEAEDQWSLITHGDGHRLGHRLVRYMDEREIYAERWHGAIRDWPGDLSLAWGLLDPVATTDVLGGIRELRPAVEVTEYPDLGHYPQVEDPERLSETLRGAIGRSGATSAS